VSSPPGTVALLRGINVGRSIRIAMPDLAEAFRDAGHRDVRTYIQSGNVLLSAAPGPEEGPVLETAVERMLESRFGVPIMVIVRSRDELAATIAAAPADHGSPDLRSDVYFLKHPLTADEALAQVPELREGVDAMATGPGALYFSRVAQHASKTRITGFMGKPVFRRLTVRNWRTATTLLRMLDGDEM